MKSINIISRKIKNIPYNPWYFPLALLVMMFVAYGLFIFRLGFYWDDWTQLLVSRLYGNSAYWAYFASDRPTSAWTHVLFMPLLGFKPIHWQIFTLLLRWLTVVAMWYTLGLIWPKYKRTITVAAFLFAVYPAFIQQAPSVAFHQHWLQFLFYFASLACMIHSLKDGKLLWRWMAASLVLEMLQFSITEFYAGIELIRPLILWFILSAEAQVLKRSKKVLLNWLPYLLVLLGFIVWRLFLSNVTKNEPSLMYALVSHPASALVNLLRMVAEDQIYIVISSWGKVFNLALDINPESLVLFSWAVVFGLVLLLWGYFSTLPDNGTNKEQTRREIILLGVFVTLLGPAPIWLTGKNMLVDNDFHVDRFAMASMWGISLLIVVLVELLIRDWRKSALALSIVVAFAAGLQIRVAGEYSRIWQDQKSFYWQLLWRAPYIEPGTALVSEDTILEHQELFSTGSAINHLYPQSEADDQLAYWMYRLSPNYDEISPDDNPVFNTTHRIYKFRSNLNESLVIQFNPDVSACLWVLSAIDEYNPKLPAVVRQAAVHSNLNRIYKEGQNAAGYPPLDMIGKEPQHDWCYLYQKAELAMQFSQPKDALALLYEADEMGYQPADGITHAREWIPMVSALIQDNEFERAGEISQVLINKDVHDRAMICALWDGESQDANMVNWVKQLHCSAE